MSDEVDLAPLLAQPRVRLLLAKRDITMVYRILQRHGVSQRHIAALTRQAQSEVNAVTQGRRVLRWDVLERIVDGLGVPRGWVGLAHDEETAALLEASTTPQ